MPANRLWQLIAVMSCAWLMLVQPGVSYYWLIDSHLHAEIDADRYGQTPDGRTLPGRSQHPPHEHPSSEGVTNSEAVSSNGFDAAFYAALFAEANRPSLQGRRLELAVIALAVVRDPPEHPPCA